MTSKESNRTTVLLQRLSAGDASAADELIPLLYDELRRIAQRLMSADRPDRTLQPTALINEAFLKLVHVRDADWRSRAHFLCVAARAMRSVLTDYARASIAEKRRGQRQRVTLHDEYAVEPMRMDQIIAVHEGIDALSEVDERFGRIVELRFFGGFENKEIAEILDTSLRSVERGWRFARSWLKQHFDSPAECRE